MNKKERLHLFLIFIVFFSSFASGAIPADERAALIALYNSTDGDNWTDNSGWKTPPLDTDGFAMPGTEGTWYGITVSVDHVTEIDLILNNLIGNIPPDLGNLTDLQNLYLASNQLTGSIPSELGNLSNLQNLYLHANYLSGSIPPELGNLSNLKVLSLWTNFWLNGSIPPELGNLSNLQTLSLSCNNLSGSIPPELGDLLNLGSLYIDNNKLSGEIPKTIMNLSKLAEPYVDIGYNCLYTYDTELKTWLNSVDPDWEIHQNECGFTLTVKSSPDTGIPIRISPGDSYGQKNGNTEFFRTYDIDTVVTLNAPASYDGNNFDKWLIDGAENTSQTIQVTMNKNHTVKAVYESVTYTVTVQSFPDTGVGITAIPSDKNGNSDGDTNFTRTYDSGTEVTLTAPSEDSGKYFIKWTVDSIDYTDRIIQLTMDSSHNTVVYYAPPPEIAVNRNSLNLCYIVGSSKMPVETFTIINGGSGTLNWSMNTEMYRISLNPTSGTDYGIVEVTVNPVGLTPGKFTGVIYVEDPLASNSPVDVEIKLLIKTHSQSSPPFGEFSTPLDNSIVRSSIPVTGWVLGDTGVESVKIYREEGKNMVYIGDAILIEGARPDVEAAYPDYPMNYKAGWGYMMLTNILPNGGNGTFKIHAIATDKEGRTTTLGIKTIHVDNANAVKPFGAIDTPTQGGTASGSQFINWGWVLIPQPNSIPTDGSTIYVIVDGVNIGHPTYNVYRADIAGLFPGYANSNGAVGYFYLDTTAYENGVHTIQWTATDSAGNTDGIGSRYFMIENTGSSKQRSMVNGHWSLGKEDLSSIPVDHSKPIRVKKGYEENRQPQEVYPDEEGFIRVEIKELERVEVQFDEQTDVENHLALKHYNGYMVVGDQLRPLPIGSTLDVARGVFYWQPGPGFLGEYELIFVKAEGNDRERVRVKVKIVPKH